jgi:SOS response regulatory protein OraA/RecX
MPAIQSKAKTTTSAKSEAEVLSEATRRLLKGIKANAKKKGKSLSREDLLRRGYSEEFIAQLTAA